MNNPEQLFELFYKNISDDMCPPGLCRSSYRRNWWRERFMYAYNNIQESRELRSWAETPQMWLAGYRQQQPENTPEPKPKFVPPPPLIRSNHG